MADKSAKQKVMSDKILSTHVYQHFLEVNPCSLRNEPDGKNIPGTLVCIKCMAHPY